MHDRLHQYRHRIHEAFPNLTVHTLRLIDHGQSNDVVVMDEELIFRFPRYAAVVPEIKREVAVLRALQGRVSVPIPNPVYVCLEDATPGQAFVGYAAVPGEPLHPLAFERGNGTDCAAATVAQVLRELHAVPAVEVLPRYEVDRDPLTWWCAWVDRVTVSLVPAMPSTVGARVRDEFEQGLALLARSSPPRVLLHGDPGGSNWLHDPASGRITGLIDFSSVHVGDPALDLASASTIGPKFFVALAHHYPGAADMLDRIRFYRSTFALQEALFGLEHGDETSYADGMREYVTPRS